MPLRGIKKHTLMTKSNEYELYFNELGITDNEEREAVLGYIRELFAIAIDSINNEEETVEVWA